MRGAQGACVSYGFHECRIANGRLELCEGMGARKATLRNGRVIVRHSARLCLRTHCDGPNLATADVDGDVRLVAVDGSSRRMAAVDGHEVVIWAVPPAR